MNDFSSRKFVFDNILVDPQANLIVRNGVEKRLEPKLMTLLCLFVSKSMQVIDRQQITETVWPNVVVGEESITRAIFALRNVLGDDAKQPRYIETIPKKGYRFLTEASLFVPDVPATAPAKPRYRIFAAFGFMIVVAIIAGLLSKPAARTGFEIDKILPMTKLVGSEGEMAIQPSGKKMAFVHNLDAKSNIYIYDSLTGNDSIIASDELTKSSLMWIDENTLAYIRCNSNNCEIVRQYQNQTPEVLYNTSKKIYNITLAKNNVDSLVFTEYQNNESVELKSINLRNGSRENLRTTYPGLPKQIFASQYTADGKHLVFLSTEAGKPFLSMLDLTSKEIQPISDKFDVVKSFYLVDQQLLVAGTFNATQGLWLLNTDDKTPSLLLRASGEEQILGAIMDVKAKVIYYQNFQTNMDVGLTGQDGSDDLAGLNSNGYEGQAVFSEDEKDIYFLSNRSGYTEVWRYSREHKQVKQITNLKALSIIGPIFSPDGKQIAVQYRTDNLYLAIINLDNGELVIKRIVPAYRFPLSWSRDGRYVYASEHEANINLFRYDVKTLDVSIVQKNAGLFAQESRDGKALLFVDYSRNGLVKRDLISGEEIVLRKSIQGLTSLSPGQFRLDASGENILAILLDGRKQQLYKYPFASANSNDKIADKKLMDLPESSWATHINANGDSVLHLQSKPPSGDIMKIELRK